MKHFFLETYSFGLMNVITPAPLVMLDSAQTVRLVTLDLLAVACVPAAPHQILNFFNHILGVSKNVTDHYFRQIQQSCAFLIQVILSLFYVGVNILYT